MGVGDARAEDAAGFTCRQCGACCRWRGTVRLDADEVDEIAAFLGMEPRAFIERYTALAPDRRGLTLTDRPDGACILLTPENLCRVHPVKPRQCRDFPVRWHVPGYEALCRACREQPPRAGTG